MLVNILAIFLFVNRQKLDCKARYKEIQEIVWTINCGVYVGVEEDFLAGVLVNNH